MSEKNFIPTKNKITNKAACANPASRKNTNQFFATIDRTAWAIPPHVKTKTANEKPVVGSWGYKIGDAAKDSAMPIAIGMTSQRLIGIRVSHRFIVTAIPPTSPATLLPKL